MSPIERWKIAFRIEDMRLPVDAGELEIICCEWDEHVAVSHIGIEKANCIFNSAALQDLRRRHPGPDDLQVDIKWNKTSMRHIWVRDVGTGDWICVPNRDATTAAMSAAEVSIAKKLAKLPEAVAAVVQRVSSQRARHALAAQFAPNKGRMKANAMKKMGLGAQAPTTPSPPSPAQATRPPSPERDATAAAPVAQQSAPSIAEVPPWPSNPVRVAAPEPTSVAIAIPIFQVIHQASPTFNEGAQP